MTTDKLEIINKSAVKKDEKKIIENDGSFLFGAIDSHPKKDDIVEGFVIEIKKSSVFIDLPPHGTGIIYGREFINARDIIRHIVIGDKIAAKVVDSENDDGYIELSLREARQAIVWAEAEEIMKNKSVLDLVIKDANKGGLIIEWNGVLGFLPASQLKPEHYPRVEDGNKERIFEELKKFIGQKIPVTIISTIQKEDKLIFSEKDSDFKEREEIVNKYSVGDVLEGNITGIVDFGLFIKIEEGLEGLVHISEMDWGLVKSPKTMFKVGEKVSAKVIEVKDGKISLSIKATKENPWQTAKSKYNKGDIVSGVVIKFNKHGALVSLEEGVAGLVHISEFESEEKMKEKISLGSTHPFQITLFDSENQKMILSFLDKDKIAK